MGHDPIKTGKACTHFPRHLETPGGFEVDEGWFLSQTRHGIECMVLFECVMKAEREAPWRPWSNQIDHSSWVKRLAMTSWRGGRSSVASSGSVACHGPRCWVIGVTWTSRLGARRHYIDFAEVFSLEHQVNHSKSFNPRLQFDHSKDGSDLGVL